MLKFIRSNTTMTGRVGRKTYWQFLGLSFALLIISGIIVSFIPEASSIINIETSSDPFSYAKVIGILCFLLLTVFVLNVCITIRRLHDRNMSGWWILLNIIPYIGGLIIFIICGFLKGTVGKNKYGEGVTV